MGEYADRARQLRPSIVMGAQSLPDDVAAGSPELFQRWETDTTYVTGTKVTYNDTVYSCLQDHTSQETWTPEASPSLWAKVLNPDPSVIPDWEQPESTNAYMKGDKVRHNDKIWISDIDNNVWEPGVYGWSEVSE